MGNSHAAHARREFLLLKRFQAVLEETVWIGARKTADRFRRERPILLEASEQTVNIGIAILVLELLHKHLIGLFTVFVGSRFGP